MKYIASILFTIIFLLSCQQGTIFESKKNIKNSKWTYTDTLSSEFVIDDVKQSYDICLDVYYTKDYPFQNIYFKITDDFTGESNTDIFTVNLFDKYGAALGKSKKGGYKKKIILRKGFIFKNGGNHIIKILQFTRKDSLEGINELTFCISNLSST